MLDICKRKIGEVVVYRRQGMYKIQEIKEQEIGGICKNYYVLRSIYDSNSSLYVPTDADNLSDLMEDVLSEDDIFEIIDKSKENPMSWIENTSERAEVFDNLIKSGDLVDILKIYRLYAERKLLKNQRLIKNSARDERIFAKAQKIIHEAFAYSLKIDVSGVSDYISKR